MRSLRIVTTFAMLALLIWHHGVSAQELTPDQVLQIAEKGSAEFVNAMMFEYVKEYGVKKSPHAQPLTLEQVQRSRIPFAAKAQKVSIDFENPFEVYTINFDSLMAPDAADKLPAIIVSTDTWFVPVNFDGKARGNLTLAMMDGEWQVVGISMGEFGERIKRIPPEYRPGMSTNARFIRLHAANIDLVAVEDRGEIKLRPFDYSRQVFAFDETKKNAKGLMRARDILPGVARRVRMVASQNLF